MTTHYTFCALSLPEQLALVWVEGTFLMTRREDADAVHLYYLPGRFFAEVYYNEADNLFYRVRTSLEGSCLASYAEYVRLPPELL